MKKILGDFEQQSKPVDQEDRSQTIREKLKTGDIDEKNIELAAYFGDDSAREMLGDKSPKRDEYFEAWVESIAERNPAISARVIIEALGVLYSAWGKYFEDDSPYEAFEALQEWFLDPEEGSDDLHEALSKCKEAEGGVDDEVFKGLSFIQLKAIGIFPDLLLEVIPKLEELETDDEDYTEQMEAILTRVLDAAAEVPSSIVGSDGGGKDERMEMVEHVSKSLADYALGFSDPLKKFWIESEKLPEEELRYEVENFNMDSSLRGENIKVVEYTFEEDDDSDDYSYMSRLLAKHKDHYISYYAPYEEMALFEVEGVDGIVVAYSSAPDDYRNGFGGWVVVKGIKGKGIKNLGKIASVSLSYQGGSLVAEKGGFEFGTDDSIDYYPRAFLKIHG